MRLRMTSWTCSKGPVLEEIAACREDFVGSEWSFVLLLQASSNADQETAPIMGLMTETLDALPMGFFHAGLEDILSWIDDNNCHQSLIISLVTCSLAVMTGHLCNANLPWVYIAIPRKCYPHPPHPAIFFVEMSSWQHLELSWWQPLMDLIPISPNQFWSSSSSSELIRKWGLAVSD